MSSRLAGSLLYRLSDIRKLEDSMIRNEWEALLF